MRKVILLLIVDLAFLIVFNLLFFVILGVEHNAGVWISYGFIHFSYFMVLLTPVFYSKEFKSVAVGRMTIGGITGTYFFVELVAGIVFVVLNLNSMTIPLIVQVVLVLIFIVILIVNILANDRTADSDNIEEKQVSFVRNESLRVKALMDCSDNKEVNKKVESIYDLIHSSPFKSCEEASYYEGIIDTKINELENIVNDNNSDAIMNICNEIIDVVNKRNNIVRQQG